jgi:hypothetical protein
LSGQSYFDELDRRFDTGFDPARSIPANDESLRLPVRLLLVATRDAEPGSRPIRRSSRR